jgi:2-amino-4-hydroxy-6-hydroxymethyldihydropteridine diphosphokinase
MRTFLLLGSNLGDSLQVLSESIKRIDESISCVEAVSSVWISQPWGFKSDHRFFNQAIEIDWDGSAPELLFKIKAIEQSLGRERKSEPGYHDRLIDIDILLIEHVILESEQLTIPHKLMHMRAFALLPLAEIAAEVFHPVQQKTVNEILKNCPDNGLLYKLPPCT